MNLKEYISSGIVESYVLGLVTEAERTDFEAMCQQHPEVAEARTQFEIALETQLLAEAIAPPLYVKSKIQESLVSLDTANTLVEETHLQTPVRRLSAWKLLAAASVLLLAGSLFWAVTVNNKYQSAQQANIELRNQLDQSAALVTELNRTSQTLQNRNVKTTTLQGTENSPGSFANVYWDSTTKDVYLLVNNMPAPVTGNQYQLWALINDQPIDLGVIEPNVWQRKLLVQMKNVQNAQAFAITLEPRGGSVSPTGKMYVVGKL